MWGYACLICVVRRLVVENIKLLQQATNLDSEIFLDKRRMFQNVPECSRMLDNVQKGSKMFQTWSV